MSCFSMERQLFLDQLLANCQIIFTAFFQKYYLCGMAFQPISIVEFLRLAALHPVLDVRSPGEYHHAHIPGAISLPLFDDEERKIVGTAYKQKSREVAIKIGLEFFGGKMRSIVEHVEHITEQCSDKTVLVHCWRGGMRSGAIAWLLDLYGFQVYTLQGGYKAFRNWVLQQFEKQYKLRILSGYTGSGKTEILHEMEKLGERILDLEGIAGHRGSAFGALGLPKQGSTEQFENKLALRLNELAQSEDQRPIWTESESSRIGDIYINHLFFDQMKHAEHVHIEVPLEARLKFIVEEYGGFDKEGLKAATLRIQKRLGHQEMRQVLDFLDQGDIYHAFEILILYYDRFYKKSTMFNSSFIEIELAETDPKRNAKIILQKINQNNE